MPHKKVESVAIITMHRVINYGSILQAFALYHYIQNLGYEVKIVDYKFPNEYHSSIANKYAATEPQKSWFRQHMNGLCSRLLRINGQRKKELFNSFIDEYIRLSRPYTTADELISNPPKADIYLTGSDQVWNPRYVGEDYSFALNWVKDRTAKKISYAASFGVKESPEEFAERLAGYLSSYNYVSVREHNKLLDEMNIEHTITLDPTFLLNKNDWCEFFKKHPIVKGKYLLCYLIGYSFNPFPYVDRLVNYIRREIGLKVVMIAGEPINLLRGYKLYNDCGPKEFLNLFYNASMVLTTSFHGTAFAINFEKPFLTVVDSESDNDNRQSCLVNLMGCDASQIIRCGTPFSDIEIPVIKNTKTPRLDEERTKSQNFLKTALNG